MEIVTLCAAAVTAVIAAAGLKKYSPETSIMLSLACGVMILLTILPKFTPVSDEINRLIGMSGLDSSYAEVLIKTIGICILGKFTTDLCNDNGYTSLGSKIEFASRLSVLIISLPLYGNVINMAADLLGVS